MVEENGFEKFLWECPEELHRELEPEGYEVLPERVVMFGYRILGEGSSCSVAVREAQVMRERGVEPVFVRVGNTLLAAPRAFLEVVAPHKLD